MLRQGSGGRDCGKLSGRESEGTTITYLIAKEGDSQGDVVVALGVHTLDIPANAFIHPAVVPYQEAARKGNMNLMTNPYTR